MYEKKTLEKKHWKIEKAENREQTQKHICKQTNIEHIEQEFEKQKNLEQT